MYMYIYTYMIATISLLYSSSSCHINNLRHGSYLWQLILAHEANHQMLSGHQILLPGAMYIGFLSNKKEEINLQ